MFSWLNCAYEIYKVARTRRESDYPSIKIGDAYSMFKADVLNGAATPDNTGDILADFDFASAKAAWDSMTEEEQSAARTDILDFINEEIIHDDLTAVFTDREKFQSLIDEWYPIRNDREAVRKLFGKK